MQKYIGKIVQLIYIDSKREVSIRNIRVIATGEEKFMAYCYSKKDVRTFNHSGIVSIDELNPKLLGVIDQINQHSRSNQFDGGNASGN
ncbi:hypothetical protein [Paenibacillus camelliae]|uniref:hypothetical protein n=1 Tax=Paenibacillus camelliae TaxID=512410 RepID=UPI00203BD79D|nr:hypothetical protein [Paenibacillus camelliae]MCM3632910.1 hypothetical protein [Paenibacillus camelliae]